MSKWMKVLLLSLGSLCTLAMSIFLYNSQLEYEHLGKKAKIDKNITITLEKTSSDKDIRYLAHMSYINNGNQIVKFQRYINDDLINRIKNKEDLYVEYIPNQSNTERLSDESSSLKWFFSLFAGFTICLIYVIRGPSTPDSELSAAPLFLAWKIRILALVIGISCLFVGITYLIESFSKNLIEGILFLTIGSVFCWLFKISLRMR